MPLKDGQKFGQIKVKKVADHTGPEDDPKAQPSAEEKQLVPKGKEVRVDRIRHDFLLVRVPEPAKGKESDDSTPERVSWIHRGKLVSAKQAVRRPQVEFDVDRERGMFMAAEDLWEVDLATGAMTKLPYEGWSGRKPPRSAHYLPDDQVLISSSKIHLGKRSARGVALVSALDLETLGFVSLDQRVFFSSHEDAVVFGHDAGGFRVLARLGAWGAAPWLVSDDTFRFYVDPFQNEGLSEENCGTFELAGALAAWKHCFRDGHAEDYAAIELNPL